MNTLIDIPASARHENGMIVVLLESGMEFTFPCSAYPRLATATIAERASIETSPMGLHWPALDEDLSIRGLLREHGQALTSAHKAPLLTPDPSPVPAVMTVPPSTRSQRLAPGQA